MEGISEAESELVVYVHPSQIKNVRQAILRELSSLLFKYNEALDGVVLAYKFDTPSDRARILSGVHPYFAVKLRANLLLFSPKPTMLVEGKVVKVVRESIHVIVLGFASAVITDQEIRKEFRYKHKHGEGLYVNKYHKRHAIKVGTLIRFVAKSWDEEVLHISGSLIPAHTGSITWLDKYSEDAATFSNKRMAETIGETHAQDHISTGGASSVVDDPNIKVKKRRVIDTLL